MSGQTFGIAKTEQRMIHRMEGTCRVVSKNCDCELRRAFRPTLREHESERARGRIGGLVDWRRMRCRSGGCPNEGG